MEGADQCSEERQSRVWGQNVPEGTEGWKYYLLIVVKDELFEKVTLKQRLSGRIEGHKLQENRGESV